MTKNNVVLDILPRAILLHMAKDAEGCIFGITINGATYDCTARPDIKKSIMEALICNITAQQDVGEVYPRSPYLDTGA